MSAANVNKAKSAASTARNSTTHQHILIRPAQYGIDLGAIDLRAVISLTEATALPALRGRRGQHHRCLLARWCTRGKPTPDGARVLFPAVRSAAGVWVTTAAWVERFVREVMRRGSGGSLPTAAR